VLLNGATVTNQPKRTGSPVALALCGLTVVALVATSSPALAGRREIRVMSYNIRQLEYPDLDDIEDDVEFRGVDVVGIQEIYRRQAKRLARRLGFDRFFAFTHKRDGVRVGHALFSRFHILERRQWKLPRGIRDDTGEISQVRKLAKIEVRVGRRRIRVFNTHLEHSTRYIREAQASAIKARIDGRRKPTILLCDCNATPGSQTIDLIRDEFRDAWRMKGEGSGPTCCWSPGDPDLERRIDYGFLRRRPRIPLNLVRTSTAALGNSDHLAVYADVVIRWG
jgi:endonuclease/exonuclease/phosphatase family metal-dependent hydrolase